MNRQATPTAAAPWTGRRRHAPEWLAPALVFAPALAPLGVVLLCPVIESLRLSLVEWNGLGKGRVDVGLDNWSALLRDAQFWRALGNNLLLALVSVLGELPIALALALLLDKAGRGSRTLKILYFLPLLFSSVALGVIFKNIFDPNFGPINTALNAIGATALAQHWLGDRRFALLTVTAVVCWQNTPFYMILFLAALASFPPELREAARLDGARDPTTFWKNKIPHPQGRVLPAAMLAVIGSLRYFGLIYVMTGGGPEGASELMATYMSRTVFSSFQLGYGSTVASAMFLVVALIAAFGMRLTKRFETRV